MLLPILLLASSGLVLASPRVKGPQVTPYGRPLPYQHQHQQSFRVPEQPGVNAPHKSAFEIIPGSSDSDSILIKVKSENFGQFLAQSGIDHPHSQNYASSNLRDNSVDPKTQTFVASNNPLNVPLNPQPSTAQFTGPSNPQTYVPSNTQSNDPSSVQFSVPSNPQPSAPFSQSASRNNVQPNYDAQARHSIPQHSPYSAAFQGVGAGRKMTDKELLIYNSIGQILRHTPGNARLISTNSKIPLKQRLPSNYTLIRPNVVDTFSCDGRHYGYYADVDNECQIFHLCMPLKLLYGSNSTEDGSLHWSFICPERTRFSQDVLVCVWEEEAVDCQYSPDLYWINLNNFRKVPDESGTGERYAELNEPLVQGR